MILAVVKHGAEIHDGETGEIAAGGCVADTLFHGRNPVPRNCAAKNVVYKLNAFAAFNRLHLDAAYSELAVPSRLLLVLALGVGPAADGFAVRHFWWLQREVY